MDTCKTELIFYAELLLMIYSIINIHGKLLFFTICGIQQITKVIERTAISLANARSSAVEPISGDDDVSLIKEVWFFERAEARETLLNAPLWWPSLRKTRDTAKLQQTIEKHNNVPVK